MSESKIFIQNRALGYVSNHIPVVTRYIDRRRENLIVTCVGKSFHTYGCSHFSLLSVSGQHPGDITSLSADKYHVYTASENDIFAWRRGRELKHTYKGHKETVHILFSFGAHLLSVDESSTVKGWDIKTEEEIFELKFSNDTFKITTMIHPHTYLNKFLFGSEQGQMQLWNIKHSKMIYIFKGWGVSITAMEQAPAIDVIAIGLITGKIILHNIKFDETIFELLQDLGPITCITFRSDGQTIMATGSLKGHITLWNLEKRKVESQIMNAHISSVTGLRFLPNEPLMVSSSPDNSLKLWIFDLADGGGRLLRIREGFAEPPTFARFYGTDGANVLTSGGDSSLRIFSTITETFNKSLGRASSNRAASKRKGKLEDDSLIMPPITQFASEKTREKEWDNIAAIHSGTRVITTWSYNKLKMGEHKLLPERLKHNHNLVATSICLTQCGNFVFVGYSTGHVDKFNIQSGIHRGSYGENELAHSSTVTGITVDPLNQIVVTVSKDSLVKFWAFKITKGKELNKLNVNEPVCWLRTHKETSLIALALEDFSLILIDIDTMKMVRKFEGHTAQITDATFSPDARWLITASMDYTIRTWDIPSTKLIDIFKVHEICTSLHFSPTGQFLVTSHICNLGIYLWANKTLYTYVSLKAIDPCKPIPVVSLPSVEFEKETNHLDEEEGDIDQEYVSVDQISEDLITMTTLATSRWQNLLDIELVKKRNKPKEPPKTVTAPFFLPTIPSLELKFDFSKEQSENDNSKLLIPADFQNLSPLGKIMINTIETRDFDEPIKLLKNLGPGSIDLEIKSLDSSPEQATTVMIQFFKMLHFMFTSKVDYELAQAYLGVFVKNHGSTLVNNKKLRNYMEDVEKLQMESWNLLRTKLFYNLSIVQHLKTL